MNYRRAYNNLMTSRFLMKERRVSDKKNLSLYFEKHHIIPKSLGGKPSRGVFSENIVLLTAREHFIAHWLLWLIYRNRSMAYAFISMTRQTITNKQQRYYSSRGYEIARLAFSDVNKGEGNHMYGKPSINKGKNVSNEQKLKQSIAMKGKYLGKDNPFFNKKHSLEIKKILSDHAKTRVAEKSSSWKGYKLIFLNEKLVHRCKTVSEVAKFIDGTESGVKNVLGGNQKTTKGYIIKYENNS